ncbi:MAG: hypothetical protein MZW92_36195 [Comamonadaceae bacterium]|nr:hypothetical protein [Comamonadaceae bacterium]
MPVNWRRATPRSTGCAPGVPPWSQSTQATAAVAAMASVPDLPEMVPPVRAHTRYGGRGNLRNFLREALRAAFPGAVDSRTLGDMAVRHFWATFESDRQRQYFRRKLVPHALRKLVVRGEVERLHARGDKRDWRMAMDGRPAISGRPARHER